ncbi:MAG: hypothetical protein IH977_11555, partial [Nitrospinae bacterium]|nr:hypothetical protein [Nitrospinota bacterium]
VDERRTGGAAAVEEALRQHGELLMEAETALGHAGSGARTAVGGGAGAERNAAAGTRWPGDRERRRRGSGRPALDRGRFGERLIVS